MVNKAALAVVGVVVIGVVGVGMLVGTVLDGGDGPASNDNDDGGAEGPAGNGTATQTAANVTTTPVGEDDDARTPILPRRFDSGLIAENVTRLINEERANRSLDSLDTTGETANSLTTMAEGHSQDMADAGYVLHNVSGTDTSQRYRENDLFETCKYSDQSNVYNPDNTDRFEVIDVGAIGQYHQVDGNETFIENESHAATVIVDEWMDDDDAREDLMVAAFNRMGVGVEITRNNAVYVTVNLCE